LRSNAVDNPADKNSEVAEETSKQLTGNAIRESTEGRALKTDMDIWRNEDARATSSAGYYIMAKTADDSRTED
jgi:hypothetical protein